MLALAQTVVLFATEPKAVLNRSGRPFVAIASRNSNAEEIIPAYGPFVRGAGTIAERSRRRRARLERPRPWDAGRADDLEDRGGAAWLRGRRFRRLRRRGRRGALRPRDGASQLTSSLRQAGRDRGADDRRAPP